MKKLTKKYSVRLVGLLLLLTLLPASCIKDDYASKESATVTMTFTTRAISNPTADAGGLEANEHMRTLRVIVAKKTGEILYNLKYDIAEDETSKTITFSEMTVNADGEALDFYAIANEEGVVGYDGDWNSVSVTDLTGMTLSEENFLTAANASANIMIPQTAYKEITVTPQSSGGIQIETMTLDFAVVKVRLTINNTSSSEQSVNDINLSGLNMTSTPLLADGTLSDVKNGELELNGMTISAGGSATVYAYFFENTGGDYKLTADWNGTQEIALGDYGISKIERGTLLDITVNLQADVTISTTVEVLDWNNKEMDVPAFE